MKTIFFILVFALTCQIETMASEVSWETRVKFLTSLDLDKKAKAEVDAIAESTQLSCQLDATRFYDDSILKLNSELQTFQATYDCLQNSSTHYQIQLKGNYSSHEKTVNGPVFTFSDLNALLITTN